MPDFPPETKAKEAPTYSAGQRPAGAATFGKLLATKKKEHGRRDARDTYRRRLGGLEIRPAKENSRQGYAGHREKFPDIGKKHPKRDR